MSELNPEQRSAVEHGEGPVLVIAGPGSGKTRVITERIVHLLTNVPGVAPENIVALTFTDKAAGEMKQRVEKMLPGLPSYPHISTFHSFCRQILEQRHLVRPLLDKVDVWIFLRRRMQALGLEYYRKLAEPGAFLHALNDFFSRCQDELIEPADFEAWVAKQAGENRARAVAMDAAELKVAADELEKKQELARVFQLSRQLLEEAGCSSLGSLISETVRLFDREPEVLRRYRERYRYVLVDEFQDSNYAQVELLRRLVVPPRNIMAVGDDDQAIYRFRGASHGAFEMFDRVFPRDATVYLDRNYRSTRRILRVATAVIRENRDRYEAKRPLRTEKHDGQKIFLLESPDYASEAAWIADEIQRLAGSGKSGFAYGDIAVLYRAHSHRAELVDEFRRRRVPFSIRRLSILSTVIARDLVAYLNVIHSPHANVSLTRVLVAPHWRFPEELALEVRKQAGRERCSLYTALETMEKSPAHRQLEATGWPELKRMLTELRAYAARASVTSLFDRLVDRLELQFLPGDPDRIYVKTFREFLEEWEKKAETVPLDPEQQRERIAASQADTEAAPGEGEKKRQLKWKNLAAFMDYFEYFLEAAGQIEAPEPENPLDAVQMMTVHAAKGLEFPVVFVISVAPRRFPHSEQRPVIEFPDELRKAPAPPADIHLQEERRLFYVALTRAQERLYVSSVLTGRSKKPSKFVEDLQSDPAARARDIELIQVPALEPPDERSVNALVRPASAESPSERVLLTEHAAAASAQASLFPPGFSSDYVRPPIRDWASRPPGGGLFGHDGKIRLSATAIEDYESCPLRFKFGHLLRIPTGPAAALTFGHLMHRSVRHYFELRRSGLPRFEDLEAFYLESWKDVGFEDPYQAEAYQKAGLDQLRAFLERQNTLAVEADEIASEQGFALDMGDVVLEGRIDQINPLAADFDPPAPAKRSRKKVEPQQPAEARSRHGAVELVDYKTGRPRTQKDADQSLQLSVYALAARRELGKNPARLTFYNLTNNQPVSTVRTSEDLNQAERKIREVAAEIKSQFFPATPGFVCKHCDFVAICPSHEENF